MSNAGILYTQVVSGPNAAQGPGKAETGNAGKGANNGEAAVFFDLFLAGLSAKPAIEAGATGAQTSTNSKAPGAIPGMLNKTALQNPDILPAKGQQGGQALLTQLAQAFGLPGTPESAEQILAALTAGTPQADARALPGGTQPQTGIGNMSAALKGGQKGENTLITANLTPEALTRLSRLARDIENAGDLEAAFADGLPVVLTPAQAAQNAATGEIGPGPTQASGDETAGWQSLAQRLNAINVGSNGNSGQHFPNGELPGFQHGILDGSEPAGTAAGKAADALKAIAGRSAGGQQDVSPSGEKLINAQQSVNAAAQQNLQQIDQHFSRMLQGFGTGAQGDSGLWPAGEWGNGDIAADGRDIGAVSLQGSTRAGLAAAPVLNAAQAGQAHPSTRMVAAHIQKMAENGKPQNITLELDPPDLGRVQVRLEMGADRQVRAHLVIEKPETYTMLHREAQTLERALENSGVEGHGSGLSFELAQDHSAFDHGDEREADQSYLHGKSRGKDGGENAEGEEESASIAEAVSSWYRDPLTGLMRYDGTA